MEFVRKMVLVSRLCTSRMKKLCTCRMKNFQSFLIIQHRNMTEISQKIFRHFIRCSRSSECIENSSVKEWCLSILQYSNSYSISHSHRVIVIVIESQLQSQLQSQSHSVSVFQCFVVQLQAQLQSILKQVVLKHVLVKYESEEMQVLLR